MGLAYLTNYVIVEHSFSRAYKNEKSEATWQKDYQICYVLVLLGSCASHGIFLGGVLDVRSAILSLADLQVAAP